MGAFALTHVPDPFLDPVQTPFHLAKAPNRQAPPPYDSQHSSLDTMTCRVIS